jgi:hypothetical protein
MKSQTIKRATIPLVALTALLAGRALPSGHDARPGTVLAVAFAGGESELTDEGEAAKNSPNNPQFMRDVDNPARNEPFQAVQTGAFAAGATTLVVSLPAVAAGKRLVIEHVSALVELPPASGQTALVVVQLLNAARILEVPHPLVLQPQGTQFASDNFAASQPIRMYAQAGDHLQLVVNRSSGAPQTPQTGAVLGASGYFLPE